MTTEELDAAIDSGDVTKVVEATAALTEGERKKLSTHAQAREESLSAEFRRCEVLWHEIGKQGRERTEEERQAYSRASERSKAARIAVLAVGPLSAAKKLEGWYFFIGTSEPSCDAAFEVLDARRPEWADAWLDAQLQAVSRHWGPRWEPVYRLVRAGVCQRPTTTIYANLVFLQIFHAWRKSRRGALGDTHALAEWLAASPDLLDELWVLFEVENRAFARKDEAEALAVAVANLSRSGVLDRERLLVTLLTALTRDFKRNMQTGFCRLFGQLEVTALELARHQLALMDLLASPTSHVSSFAIKQLKSLQRSGELDAGELIPRIGMVMTQPSKSQPKTALGMLKAAVRKDADLLVPAIEPVLAAVGHGEGAVQEPAIQLLQSWLDGQVSTLTGDDRTRIAEALRSARGVVSPVHLAALDTLIDSAAAADGSPATLSSEGQGAEGAVTEAPAIEPAAPGELGTATVDRGDLDRRLERISPDTRRTLDLDAALKDVDAGRLPARVSFSIVRARVLSAAESIEPIATREDLIAAVSHAVERVESPEEIERILDGIARFGLDRSGDFMDRTAPLLARMQKVDESWSHSWSLVSRSSAGPAFYDLLEQWITGEPPEVELKTRGWGRLSDAGAVVQERIFDVARSLRRGRAAPLLALPTHRGGWIDPRVFVDRVEKATRGGGSLTLDDLRAALLRLAPDHRSEALTAATSIPGEIGRVIRWALGGDGGPGSLGGTPRASWERAGGEEQGSSLLSSVKRSVRSLLRQEVDAEDLRVEYSIWLAASRARQPTGRLEHLARAGGFPQEPDAVEPARTRWSFATRERDQRKRRSADKRLFEVAVEPVPEQIDEWALSGSRKRIDVEVVARPTVALVSPIYGEEKGRWTSAWQATIWPLNVEGTLVHAIDRSRCDWEDKDPSIDAHTLLGALFDGDRPWSELAHVGVALSLTGHTTLALDVLIDALVDGRADPVMLGDVLARWGAEWLRLPPLARAMRELARTGPVHSLAVHGIVDGLIAHGGTLPREIHHVLEVFLEVATTLKRAPGKDARVVLGRFEGKSKTAQLAGALLGIEDDPEHPQMREALLIALEGRIARAERWDGVG